MPAICSPAVLEEPRGCCRDTQHEQQHHSHSPQIQFFLFPAPVSWAITNHNSLPQDVIILITRNSWNTSQAPHQVSHSWDRCSSSGSAPVSHCRLLGEAEYCAIVTLWQVFCSAWSWAPVPLTGRRDTVITESLAHLRQAQCSSPRRGIFEMLWARFRLLCCSSFPMASRKLPSPK